MSFSGVAKFLIGFIIAISLMVGAGVAAALYFVTKLTTPPPKPIFANDKPAVKAQAGLLNNPPKQTANQSVTPTPSASATLTPVASATSTPSSTPTGSPGATAEQASPTPTPSDSPSPKPLEPGAYRARVTWSRGLSVRSDPSLDAERIAGVAYNQTIVVLAESDDKKWVKVRFEDGDTEGWVKAGNIERVESDDTQTNNQ